ncbi:hypothetical protein D1AOALGA4SA_1531 [Olavius algarvensis Delta 1 endosymbiont]|nr:hypothetical protein D1AOALGA4SA_1531 [Olavius algarvensis Delta 1 endosymbiont]
MRISDCRLRIVSKDFLSDSVFQNLKSESQIVTLHYSGL